MAWRRSIECESGQWDVSIISVCFLLLLIALKMDVRLDPETPFGPTFFSLSISINSFLEETTDKLINYHRSFLGDVAGSNS